MKTSEVLAKFIESQPRHPKGSPKGGQWAPAAGNTVMDEAYDLAKVTGRHFARQVLDAGESLDNWPEMADWHALDDPTSGPEVAALDQWQASTWPHLPDVAKGAGLAYPGNMKWNNQLRTGTATERAERWAELIDAGIANTPPTEVPITVHRGGSHFLADALTPGTVVTDPGFVSASYDARVAASFALQRGPYGGEPEFVIKVPKGARLLWPDLSSASTACREVVFPRGAAFRVVKDERWGKDRQITLEYVLP